MKTMNDLNGLVKKVFPGIERYPAGELVPSVMSSNGGLTYIFSLLLIEDNDVIETIQFKNGETQVEISLHVVKRFLRHHKDLCFSVGLTSEGGTLKNKFRMLIKGDDVKFQKHFVNVLKDIDNFLLWIVDANLQVKKVISIGFKYDKYKKTLDLLA